MARQRNALGLDIGTSSIKLVQLKESGKGIELTHFAIAPLPPDTIVDGELINTSTIIQTLQTIIQSSQLKSREVAIGLRGPSVITKMLTIPLATPEEIEESVLFEAEQQFDINEVYLDHQVMRTRTAQGQIDVMLAIAKKSVCNSLLDVVREAGLEPCVLDVDRFAIQNAFEANNGLPSDETIALLNIGANTSSLSVIDNGTCLFARDIAVGGNQYTEELRKQLNKTYADAEAYKLAGEHGVDSDQAPLPEAERVMSSVNDIVANEIRQSLDFYHSSFSSAHISKIYLSGGTAKVPSLARTIEMRTQITVDTMDPFRNIKIDPKVFDVDYIDQVRPMAAVAVGLALRHGGDK